MISNILLVVYTFGALIVLASMLFDNAQEIDESGKWPVLGLYTLPLLWPAVGVLLVIGMIIVEVDGWLARRRKTK